MFVSANVLIRSCLVIDFIVIIALLSCAVMPVCVCSVFHFYLNQVFVYFALYLDLNDCYCTSIPCLSNFCMCLYILSSYHYYFL